MLKQINKEVRICDYCLKEGKEVEAMGVVQPSNEDVCIKHFNAYTEEIRLPKEFSDEMSGKKVAVTPGYNAKMVIKYVEEK